MSQNPVGGGGGCAQTGVELTRNTNHRYIPVMITRLMISLRKTAHSQGSVWNMDEPTANRRPVHEMHSIRFASNRGGLDGQDDDTSVSPIWPEV